MLKSIWLIGLFALLSHTALSQSPVSGTYNRCVTMQADSMLRAAHPELGTLDEFENWMQTTIRTQLPSQRSGVVVQIPVIVHVVHDGEAVGTGTNLSQAQINSQIEVLNEDFRKKLGTPGHNTHPAGADIELEFCLAVVDPLGNALPEPGIDRINRNTEGYNAPPYGMTYFDNNIKDDTYWDPDLYMNIWTTDLSNDLLGYAQFPNSSTLTDLGNFNGNAPTDGVVIWYRAFGRVGNLQSPYNGGRSATHEIGHWLGLRHIWGDGGCGVDDFCADTPASDTDHSGCPTNVSSCGSVDMVENYMDYTNDACMNIFTEDQKTRIRTVIDNAARRDFTNSAVCSAPNAPPTTSFSANVLSVCSGGSIQFSDESGNAPTVWFWSFPGGTPASSSAQNPLITYNAPGTYSVSLTASNANGNASTTQTNYIVVGNAGPSVFYTEDFEGDLSVWQIDNPDNAISWEVKTVQGTLAGTKAVYVHHYDYLTVGQRDGLISPVIDLSAKSSVSLQFDHAHRRFSTNEQDSLIIYASIDGGTTYPFRVFSATENGTGNFATNSILAADFTPATADDWCYGGSVGTSCISVDLSDFDGESQLRLYFESVNDYGNNIYLDNIQLSGNCADVTSIEPDNLPLTGLSIYPNPAQNTLTVELENAGNGQGIITLGNGLGQVVDNWPTQAKNGRIKQKIDISRHPAGVYILAIRLNQGFVYHKLLIE